MATGLTLETEPGPEADPQWNLDLRVKNTDLVCLDKIGASLTLTKEPRHQHVAPEGAADQLLFSMGLPR